MEKKVRKIKVHTTSGNDRGIFTISSLLYDFPLKFQNFIDGFIGAIPLEFSDDAVTTKSFNIFIFDFFMEW